MSKPTVIDLFSGAGGMSEGFIQAGFHVVASVEKDPSAVLTQIVNHTDRKRKYRTEVIQKDLTKPQEIIDHIDSLGIKNIDVVVGGPPCQGFTRANRQTGSPDNPLNSLFRQYAKIVEILKPKIFVMENVGDLERFDNGKVCDEILETFRTDLKYKTEKYPLNAIHFGVPQRRNRLFFIGTKLDGPLIPPQKINSEKKALSVWDAISDLPPPLENGASVDELEYSTPADNKFQERMRAKTNGTVRNNIVTRNNQLVLERYKHIGQGENWKKIPDYLMANYKNKYRCHNWIYLRLREKDPSVAITHFRKSMLIHPKQNRGLSVREAARLQSFPDHFRFMGGIGFQQQQVANAVPPLLAKAVAITVRKMLEV